MAKNINDLRLPNVIPGNPRGTTPTPGGGSRNSTTVDSRPNGSTNGSVTQNGVPVTDSTVVAKRGFDESSMVGLIRSLLNGDNDVDTESFQHYFDALWNRQNSEISENWAREDAATAFNRSLYSADYNAQLGLKTAEAGRSQLYNQLIALGMSPSQAMQAAAGFTGSGSGSGGASASQAQTAGIQGMSGTGGDTPSQRLAAASSMINSITNVGQAVGNLVLTAKSIQQQNQQFYDQLHQSQAQFETSNQLAKDTLQYQKDRFAWDKQCFNNLNKWPIAINEASASEEMSSFQSALRDAYFSEGWSPEDLQGTLTTVLGKLKQGKEGSASAKAYDLYDKGYSKYGYAFNAACDVVQDGMVRSYSNEVSAGLMFAQGRQANSIAELNGVLKEIQTLELDILRDTKGNIIQYNNSELRLGIEQMRSYIAAYDLMTGGGQYTSQTLLNYATDEIRNDAQCRALNSTLNRMANEADHETLKANPWLYKWRTHSNFIFGNNSNPIGDATGGVLNAGTRIGAASILAR